MEMEIFNPSQKQILELLLTGDKTLPEIASELRISKPGASKYLKELEELRIVKGTYERNTDGRTIRYSIQPFQMVLSIDPQLKIAISYRADDTLDQNFFYLGFVPQKELRSEIKEYLKELTKTTIQQLTVILYGSVAQGTANKKSDIDLLLIKEDWLPTEKNSILRLFADAAERTTHQMKPLFLSYIEFEQMEPTLKKEIKDHGVIIFEKGKPWEKIQQELRRYKSLF
jgi:predicted nucleotidyltransferase